MKTQSFIQFVGIMIYLIFIFTVLLIKINTIKHKLEIIKPEYPLVIDIPEEYKAISNNPNNRTNLSGYIKHDTLFIEFKH